MGSRPRRPRTSQYGRQTPACPVSWRPCSAGSFSARIRVDPDEEPSERWAGGEGTVSSRSSSKRRPSRRQVRSGSFASALIALMFLVVGGAPGTAFADTSSSASATADPTKIASKAKALHPSAPPEAPKAAVLRTPPGGKPAGVRATAGMSTRTIVPKAPLRSVPKIAPAPPGPTAMASGRLIRVVSGGGGEGPVVSRPKISGPSVATDAQITAHQVVEVRQGDPYRPSRPTRRDDAPWPGAAEMRFGVTL